MTKPLCLTSLLLVAASSLLSPLANAEPLAEALTKCRQQPNNLPRLACYDEISLTASASPAIKSAAPAVDEFGLEHNKAAEKQADQLDLLVRSISYNSRKELIVEFDNGQIWQQNGSGYYDISVGERHFIKRGMFNSFSLGNDDNNRTIKVRRVQ